MRKAMMAALAMGLAAGSPAGALPSGAPVVQTAPRDGRAVAQDVRRLIAANYVVVERRAAIDKAIADGIAAGRYDKVDPSELAQRITQDMAAVAHDKHLGLRFDPRGPRPRADGSRDEAAEQANFERQARRDNYGIHELRLLPGNVRVLNYTNFVWTGPDSARALDNAMQFLMGGDAAIIDLRGNGGGDPDAVRHIASYFVPPNTRLVTFQIRNDKPTDSVTAATPPGTWPKGKPVYVLTSGRTASAAEEFSSHVADYGFATLVGETTAGAAYRNEFMPIEGGFSLSVSVGRPILAVTGGNWEGKGVAPGIAVPVDQAQARALQDAYTRLAASAPADQRGFYEAMAAGQAAQVSPAPLARPLEAYAGRYGIRVVTADGSRLLYRRDGGVSSALLPVGPDLFVLEIDPTARLHFVSDGSAVTAFELQGPNGTTTYARGSAPPSHK